ncbi:GH12584 [Drosophila grimshawi]|uniref:GH12584 n=1 Tax=Drosophila grimshawi TaxID=7222 RepID=B4JK32_DROGR|nr:GH12584 [Drosophila grimshawi]
MLLQTLLLLLLAPWSVTLGALQPPDKYRPSELMNAALYVLEQHVIPYSNALDIVELCRPDNKHRQHRNEITYLMQQLGDQTAFQLLYDTPIENPQNHILFLVNSPLAFRELRFDFAQSQYDREFHFFILLTRRAKELVLEAALRDIFETCLRFNVLKVVIMVQSELDDVVLFYGFRSYSPGCDISLKPQIVNRYDHGQMLDEMLIFDRPLSSLKGCPLNVSWYPLPPYVIFEGDSEDPQQRLETWRLTGIDGELLKMLAEILGFRIYLLAPCTFDCFQQLSARNSSVAIGAHSASHLYREFFSTTHSYHQTALVFVLRIDHYLGALNQLVQPFCPIVWLALILSCLLAVLLQWAYHRGRRMWSVHFDVAASVLHVHTTLLGNPLAAPSLPRATILRGYLGAWLLLALVQRAAYQGKLYDVFRLPYSPPVPERITQLLDGDYLYLAKRYVDYFPANRTLLSESNVEQRFKEMSTAANGDRLITSALLGNLAHYNSMNWRNSHLTHVREHIYLHQLVMFLRRHSIYKFPFDRKLKQLQSAGILTIEMFCGTFTVCYLVIIAAFLVFLLELMSRSVPWLRRFFV